MSLTAIGDPRFTVVAADPDISAVRIAAIERLVPRALDQVGPYFPGTPTRPFRVVVHRAIATLPADIREHLHPGTPGLALLGRDEIHIVLEEVQLRPPNDLGTVLAHEVVHVLLDQLAGPHGPRLPRWLHEGLAQFLSGDTYLGSREEDLVQPALVGRMLPLRDLVADFPDDADRRRQAYAQSFSFVAFLCRQVGTAAVVAAVHRSTALDGYDGGFALETGVPIAAYEDQWRAWLRDESGAPWRFLFQNCFSYMMILGFVLLALAGIRRWNRDLAVREKLEREELEEDAEEPAR